MLNELLFTKIEEEGHTAEATLDIIPPFFEDRVISRRADVVWPPWSGWTIICGVPSKITPISQRQLRH